MKINSFLAALILFGISTLTAQEVYFVKFQTHQNVAEVQSFSNQILLQNNFYKKSTSAQLGVTFFASGAGEKIPTLQNIVKMSFPSNPGNIFWDEFKKKYSSVEYIQKQIVYKIDNVPNDSLANQQWAMQKIGVYDAWNISQGSDSVIIGVIDTGIDFYHPDLKDNIYINKGETGIDALGNDKRFNGIDDDGNGFIDDYQGWDFTDRSGFPFDSTRGDYLTWDNFPMDENVYSHGTAVAGIIAAASNNRIGIAGVAPKVKVLNLRAFDPDGYGEEDDVAAALLYAIANGAKVINMSFGDVSYSYVLRDVIKYAYSKNVVLVASSGNDHVIDLHYPSSYQEVISVGNSTPEDYVSSASNYGSTLDLVAPGTDIMTTARNNGYAYFGGTSAAAPFVSATAGLLLSLQNLSNEEVKQIIKSTCDDISPAGWDIYSGAGRLNVYKALLSLAPSKFRFTYPTQDFVTKNDTVKVSATALSPYFNSLDFSWGRGLNPTEWFTVFNTRTSQFYNEYLGEIDLSQEPDTVFTLRLILHQTNGLTKEERINFSKITKNPKGEVISIFPAYYGNQPTFVSAVYSEKQAIAKMYYRKTNTGEPYSFISLDGFATNNLFVKQQHYGFVPKGIISPKTQYDIYFQIEDQLGNATTLMDQGKPFQLTSNDYFHLEEYEQESFTLPPGTLFENSFKLDSSSSKYLFLRENNNSEITSLYKFNSGVFQKVDSLEQAIPKAVGDFNHNGKVDVLSLWIRNGALLEQKQLESTSFQKVKSFSSGTFWPIFSQDVDGDSRYEIAALTNDSTATLYKMNDDLSLTLMQSLKNTSPSSYYNNEINAPYCAVANIAKDGKSELWFIDHEGDIFSYKLSSSGSFVPYVELSTGFQSESNQIAVGDFDQDGSDELAVLVHSISNIDIASFQILEIYKLDGALTNPTLNLVYSTAFVDPTVEFGSAFNKRESALRFVNQNGIQSLVVFTFPYSYIICQKTPSSTPVVTYFDETTLSNSIFIDDLTSTGHIDIAFPKSDKIVFLSKKNPSKNIPTDLIGYSLDSTKIKLSWHGNAFVNIFRALAASPNMVVRVGASSNGNFIDNSLSLHTNYLYSLSYDSILTSANFSRIEVFHHVPAKIVSVKAVSNNSLEVVFSEKIKTAIENMEAFSLSNSEVNTESPNSISPSSSYSYHITFAHDFSEGQNTLTMHNLLSDYYSSPLDSASITFNFIKSLISNKFFIASNKIVSPYKVELNFNFAFDTLSVQLSSNYLTTPANPVVSVALKSTNSVVVEFKNRIGALGIDYKLQCKNITSAKSFGMIPIEVGAGSEIVLQDRAQNIDNVYVYPSPTTIAHGQVTFAELPQYAEIYILSLTGTRINHISERDGNGGLSWNLKDEAGNTVPSGVYLYLVKQLDENKNQVAEKLGKFVIVK